MINFLRKNYLYLLIIFFAFFIRFWRLDSVPSALYYDEIDLGYQMRSYSETGKDYRGELSPFFARSFNTDKTPLPIWFSLPISKLFQSPELQVRAGTALAGVLVVILGGAISQLIFKSKATTLITLLVLSFSPWLIHFSRLAFEAQFALLSVFLFVYLFLLWQSKGKYHYYLLASFILGLSVYTYRTLTLLAPLLALVTLFVFRKDIFKLGFKKIVLAALLFLLPFVPFVYFTTIGAKDQTRISQISIFSDPKIPIEVQRSRELVSGNFQDSSLGQSASLQSKIFHNKALSYLDRLISNTLNNFSADFLFLSGDGNGRHSAKNTGELLLLDLVALVFGFYFIFQKISDKRYLYLLLVLCLGSVPSNLTLDGANHASRLITFAGPLLLIVSFGYSNLLQKIKQSKFAYVLSALVFAVWFFSLARFLNNYFFHFPVTNSREFGYGYKQAILKIENLKNDFDKIYLTGVNDPPMLYYFFWSETKPVMVQEYGTEYGDSVIRNKYLDKIKPFYPTDLLCKEKQIEALDQNAIYMVDFKNLPLDFRNADKDKVPQGVKLLDIVLYPDNEVAYYLITRDTKDGKIINPIKGQTCK